jgi:hypothetical protein
MNIIEQIQNNIAVEFRDCPCPTPNFDNPHVVHNDVGTGGNHVTKCETIRLYAKTLAKSWPDDVVKLYFFLPQ